MSRPRRYKFKVEDKLIIDVAKWVGKEVPSDVDKWMEFATRYLKLWGWNKRARVKFLSMGDGGFNYKQLHLNTSVDDFYGEVRYCADRMSMDRLLRCHVQYRTLKIKKGE
jgi:hypothetical protein